MERVQAHVAFFVFMRKLVALSTLTGFQFQPGLFTIYNWQDFGTHGRRLLQTAFASHMLSDLECKLSESESL